MKMHEIIEANEGHTTSILVEEIYKYKKLLNVYYKNYFCCEPILMVTDVFNSCAYAKIVPSNEFRESMAAYLDVNYIDEDDTENEATQAAETINFNSILFSKL